MPALPAPWPPDRLLFLLCSTAERRARHADELAHLVAGADLAALTGTMRRLRVLGIAGPRLTAIRPDAGFEARVGADRAGHRGQSQLCGIVQRQVCRALEGGGLPGVPLKGADLGARLYGDVGARPCADADVLVSRADLRAAVATVEALGYRAKDVAGRPWLVELHHLLEHPAGTLPPVEVHWRAEWWSEGFAEDVLARSAPPPPGGVRRPQPADELALLLLVHARDGLPGLRLPTDVAAWWDAYGSAVEHGALDAIADRHPGLRRPLGVAAAHCERLVGLPAADLVAPRAGHGRRARAAARLADPLHVRPVSQHVAETRLVDALLTPRLRLRGFLNRRVVPAPGHVAVVFGVPEHGARNALARASHPVRLLLRAILAAPRAAGASGGDPRPEAASEPFSARAP